MGVTHGRSYMKDKSRASDQDTFGVVKVAFDTTDLPYQATGDATAVALARANRYRLPAVIDRVAHHPGPFVDREHMGVPLDLDEPFTPTPTSPAPGVSYTDPDDIPFWWERGALTAWQVVPETLATIDRHGLWETSMFQPYKPLVDVVGGDPAAAQQLAYTLRCQINVGVLSAVDTVTWRTADAMLSSAQDYRPGCFGEQYHAWQATLDEDAVVFTTNPGNEPRGGARWQDGDLYWNGGATMPRSAQQGAAVINLYAPQYPAGGPPLDAFAYLPYTHAYFPTERFDEVRTVGQWTLGRKGDGYVALWSWRPTQWRTHDPAVTFTNGLTQPFDLVAPGGADNVWIGEVGSAERLGDLRRLRFSRDRGAGDRHRPRPRRRRVAGVRRGVHLADRGPPHVLVDGAAHRRRRRGAPARRRPLRQPLRHHAVRRHDGHHRRRPVVPHARPPHGHPPSNNPPPLTTSGSAGCSRAAVRAVSTGTSLIRSDPALRGAPLAAHRMRAWLPDVDPRCGVDLLKVELEQRIV